MTHNGAEAKTFVRSHELTKQEEYTSGRSIHLELSSSVTWLILLAHGQVNKKELLSFHYFKNHKISNNYSLHNVSYYFTIITLQNLLFCYFSIKIVN